MTTYIKLIIRYRFLVLALILLMTAGFAAIASRGVIASSIGNLFFGEDHPEYSDYKQRIREFANDEVFIIAYDDADFLSSPKARQKIRSYFKKLELQEFIDTGKELFFKRARKIHLKAKTDEDIAEIARNFKISDVRSFFAALGKNEITFDDIKEVLKEKEFIEAPKIIQDELELKRKKTDGIIIEDIRDILLRYAKCCNPVPGDEIIGYITRGKGITIHKTNCTNTGFFNQIKKEPERKINVRWNYKDEK